MKKYRNKVGNEKKKQGMKKYKNKVGNEKIKKSRE